MLGRREDGRGRDGTVGCEGGIRVVGGLEVDAILRQQRLEVGDAGLEVVDVAARPSVVSRGMWRRALPRHAKDCERANGHTCGGFRAW